MNNRNSYWIDTDPGLDDALAILAAVLEAGENIAGFSSVQGNSAEPVTAFNLARSLSRFEDLGLLPSNWKPVMVRGEAEPLLRDRRSAENIHGEDGLGKVPWQPSGDWSLFLEPTKNEKVWFTEKFLLLKEPRTLVCLGPLTNLARAIELNPSFVQKVDQLVIMGGSIKAGGNTTLAAEFNFFADPEAASIVLEAGFQVLKLVPLDAGAGAEFTEKELVRLENLETPGAIAARELLEIWHNRIKDNGIAIYDLIAWTAAIHPEWASWEELYVGVDKGRDLAYGASLPDWRGKSGNPPNCKVALSFDREMLWSHFFKLLT